MTYVYDSFHSARCTVPTAVRRSHRPVLDILWPAIMQIQSEFVLMPERLSQICVPSLFLLGGASPPEVRVGIHALAAAVPDTEPVELPGQAHTAHVGAADLLAREILRFLRQSW